MNKSEIENKLNELKNCHFVNAHFLNGDILSCPPESIVVKDNFLIMLNQNIAFSEISYIDSFH